MSKNFLILYNPKAKNGHRKRYPEKIQEKLKEHNIDFVFHKTKDKDDGLQSASDAKKNGFTDVIGVGGDGTIHHIANGTINSNLPLGIIPAGSGNDFATSLHLSKNLDDAILTLIEGKTQKLNVIKVSIGNDFFYSINIADVGIGATVSKTAETRLKWIAGSRKYTILSLIEITHYKRRDVMVTIDNNNPIKFENAYLVVGGHGQTFGSGMNVLPDARFSKDQMQIAIINNCSRIQLINALQKVWKAEHVNLPYVHMKWGTSMKIECVDGNLPMHVEAEGEVHGTSPVKLETIKKALEVYVPKDYNDDSQTNFRNK